jgi:hypothetical protein
VRPEKYFANPSIARDEVTSPDWIGQARCLSGWAPRPTNNSTKSSTGRIRLSRIFAAFPLLLLILTVGAAETPPSSALPSFEDWTTACARLPSNRSLRGRMPRKDLLPLQQFRQFDTILSALLDQSKSGPLAQPTNWVGGFPGAPFFDTANSYFVKNRGALPFQPFAQKLEIPADSQVFFHADFHGDVHSLLSDLNWLNQNGYLKGFTITRPNFYMVFLGDYTDRGSYGVEVLYTLFRLKLSNPRQFFLARGNHEELSIQSRYGFLEEGRAKYGDTFDARKLIRAYDFLPVVIYLGSGENFIQCNHGGMEPGFSPNELIGADGSIRFQLLGNLNQAKFLSAHPDWFVDADPASSSMAARAMRDFKPEDPIAPSAIGFMWNDFSVLASDPQFALDPGRAFVYGQRATQFLLQTGGAATRKLHAVFRGHQQSPVLNPMMRRIVASRGIFRHWQENDSAALLNATPDELAKHLETGEERVIPPGSVWTFNVSPDSIYGEGCNYTFDSFGLLKVAPAFADWRLRVTNVSVPAK